MTDPLTKLIEYKQMLEEHLDRINSLENENSGETDELFAAMDRFAEFLSNTENIFK